MGVKERRTKILIALFLLTSENTHEVEINNKFLTLFDLSLNQKTKSSLKALEKYSLIKKVENKELTFELLPDGFKELCLEIPFFRFLRDTWDGKLRILSYEIPEKKREMRDRLRREVAGWGLGPWHRSFWITPHPIIPYLKELVSGKEEQQYIQAFDADHIFGDREVLIEKVWKKTELDKKYKDLFKLWHEILSQDEDKIKKFSKIVNEYVNLLRQDPGLPAELIGKEWIGFEAYHIFKEIKGILFTSEEK